MANQKLKEFSYLAIIPRGLQNEISSGLQKQAKALAAAFDMNDGGHSNGAENIDAKNNALKIVTWNEQEEKETMQEALRDFSTQKKEREERQRSNPSKSAAKQQHNRVQLKEIVSSEWLPPDFSVGSVRLSSSSQQHVSIGYCPKTSDESREEQKNCENAFIPCMTCIGRWTGSAWMQLETDRRDVSQNILAPSRMLGPLVALVSVQTDNSCLEASSTTTEANESENISPQNIYQRYHQHTLEEMTKEVDRHIRRNPNVFSEGLNRALKVWRDCVETTWKDRLSPSEYIELQKRIEENRLRFRVSCVRVEPASAPSAFSRKRKKKLHAERDLFAYSRQELCLAIMDACGPQLVPAFYDKESLRKNTEGSEAKGATVPKDSDSTGGQGSGSWSVNLESFDVELVIFITPPDFRSKHGKLAFGISLCPYSFLQSKSFAKGVVPPDVTFPYLGGDIVSKGIVRLRPTTAHILLQIANLQKYDIVLDPCAGVGTIPVEAEQYCKLFDISETQALNGSKEFISIGGDLILNNPKYTDVAGVMENLSKAKTVLESEKDSLKCSSLLVAWDASHLPMRTSSVDVIVSDLPFGQRCLSASALSQLLPLIFLECARVLTPTTGRMVLLAGGSPITLIAYIANLSGKYWKKPISRVSPVTIGGILAWIVRVDRNEDVFDQNDIPKQLDLVRKIAEKRDRINRQRKTNTCEQQKVNRIRRANN